VTERPGEPVVEFRRAVTEDWPDIWPIFSAVVSAGDTYTYPPDIDAASARLVWMKDGSDRAVTYVAIEGGQVVGTAYLRPNHPGPGDHIANAGWMIAPESAGRGIGRRFAEHVIDEAREMGFTGMQFNAVVSTNERAVRLWESMGFSIVGTIPRAFRHPGEGLVSIHVMYRRL
jgi:L-amino acid N-acyltransferase YncA